MFCRGPKKGIYMNNTQLDAMMDGFMEKMAEKAESRLKNLGIAYGAGTVGSIAGMIPVGILAAPVLINTIKTPYSTEFSKETARLIKSFKKRHGLDTDIIINSLFKNPRYQPGVGVYIPSAKIHPAITLHELGHAADFKKFPVAKSIARVGGPVLGMLTSLGLMTSKDPEKRKYAPLAIMGGAAPMLYQEGKATALATRHLIREKGIIEGIKGLRHMGPAWLSYLALPAVLAGSMMAVNKWHEKKLEENKKKAA